MFDILSLPPELRNTVYTYSCDDFIAASPGGHRVVFHTDEIPCQPDLLHVSRKVQCECPRL